MHLRHWSIIHFFLLPFPSFPSSFSPFLPSLLIQLGGLGSPVKANHFKVLMSCIVSAASYRTAIDLFYDGTNHTINYVKNSLLCA